MLAFSLLLGPDLATARVDINASGSKANSPPQPSVDLLADEESDIMSCNKQGLLDVSAIAIRYGKSRYSPISLSV